MIVDHIHPTFAERAKALARQIHKTPYDRQEDVISAHLAEAVRHGFPKPYVVVTFTVPEALELAAAIDPLHGDQLGFLRELTLRLRKQLL